MNEEKRYNHFRVVEVDISHVLEITEHAREELTQLLNNINQTHYAMSDVFGEYFLKITMNRIIQKNLEDDRELYLKEIKSL